VLFAPGILIFIQNIKGFILRIPKEEFDSKLEKHRLWLNNEKGGVLAEFNGVDFSGFNFEGADLTKVRFVKCDFSRANFNRVTLSKVHLTHSRFWSTTFKGANLIGTVLYQSDFRGADFRGALFHQVDLRKSLWADVVDPPFPIYNFSLGRHLAVATPEYLAIGCVRYTWGAWLKSFKKIGRENDYSEEEIERYGKVIRLYAKLLDKDKE
jgi:hypothetical protein